MLRKVLNLPYAHSKSSNDFEILTTNSNVYYVSAIANTSYILTLCKFKIIGHYTRQKYQSYSYGEKMI